MLSMISNTTKIESLPRLHFFGDSWTSEKCELEKLIEQGKLAGPALSVPALVASKLQLPYTNYSLPASSQEEMIYRMKDAKMQPGDHAVFALTAPSRRFYLDSHNKVNRLFVDNNPDAVNDFSDSWKSACACYIFYSTCQSQGVIPWLLSTFNVSWMPETKNHIWNLIPDQIWIIPKNKCIIATDFDPEWFDKYAKEYRNSDFFDWLETKNEQVNKFIYPCQVHPNQEGRKVIADQIVKAIARYLDNEAIQ